MAAGDNLEEVIDDIADLLKQESVEALIREKAVRTGALRDSIDVMVDGDDDFVVSFLSYGVFVDQGTGTNRNIGPRPFYSQLVITGPLDGEVEDEIEDMLEDAFDEDVAELDGMANDVFK